MTSLKSYKAVTLLAVLGVLTTLGAASIGIALRMAPSFEQILFISLFISVIFVVWYRGVEITRLQRQMLQQAELDLHLHERALNLHSIVSITNPDATIIAVNENFIEAFGFNEDELIGKTHVVLYDNAYGIEEFEEVRETLGRGKVWTGEQLLKKKNGDPIRVLASIVPLMDPNGYHIKNVSIRTDVTELRNAQSEQQIKMLFDLLDDEVYMIDPDTYRFLYVNRAASRWLGWDNTNPEVMHVQDTSPDFDLAAFQLRLVPLLTGQESSVVYESRHGDRDVELSIQMLPDATNRPVYIAVARDITSRKNMEAARRELISTVSHELRTPLTSIKGSMSLLQSGLVGEIPEKAEQIIDISHRNVERMLLVINDILEIDKLDSGQLDMSMYPLDLGPFLKDAVAVNKGYADEHEVSFKTVGTDQNAVVSANEERLMQVVSNLMSNAVKYSPKQGTVEIQLEDIDGHWRVAVVDNGPGISGRDRQKIFEKFGQAESADGIKRTGTGLGLNIAKTLVERHNGRLGLKSELGFGSTFYFDLPKEFTVPTRDMNIARVETV